MGKKSKVIRQDKKPRKSEDAKKERINSFDLRINHERYRVLGRKPKNNKGVPGVSRNKAIKKRKEFALQNKLLTSKSNYFVDRRIGEYDKSVLKEDQIAARMVYERRKNLKRNIYNLNDEEEVVDLDQKMLMLDSLHDSDDEDDDKLDADFVEEAHFGGFLTKKSVEAPKTHKEIIDDLIVQNKRKKEEKKLEKEKNLDLTDKLDKEWKELMSCTGGFKPENNTLECPKNDPYDVTVQELKFESRGTPADKVKSPEQIAREENERIEKLEQEKLFRMQDDEDRKATDQVSADSIYDGLELLDGFPAPASSASSNALKEPNELDSDSDSESSGNGSVHLELDSINETVGEELGKKQGTSGSTIKSAGIETFDELLKLMSACSDKVVAVIEKLINGSDPILGVKKQDRIELLFKTLLNCIDHLCEQGGDFMKVINSLVPQLFSLAQTSPLNCAAVFRDVLLEKYEALKKQRNSAASKKCSHLISSLIILKLCGILYSTSDFRHPIVVIAMLCMSEVLCHKFVATYENVMFKLFISSLFYEYVNLSQRFVPEVINVLQTILFCSSVKDPELRRFQSFQGDQNLLLVTSVVDVEPQKLSMELFTDMSTQSGDKLKISLLDNVVRQLHFYVGIYSSLPSFPDLFIPVQHLIRCMPVEYYPVSLKISVESLDREIARVSECRRAYLLFPLHRVKPLKLFEPDFDLNFVNKKNTQSKKMKVMKDLSKKCVREQKSVMREIRRDAQFLAQQQLLEKMEKDQERRNKVKRLFQDLAAQQGEIKMSKKKV